MKRYPNLGRFTIWYRPKEILGSVSERFNSLQTTLFFTVRNGIKQYWKVKERLEGEVPEKMFTSLSKKFQCEPHEGLSLATVKGFILELVAKFLEFTNQLWTLFTIILQDFTKAMRLASLYYKLNTPKHRVARSRLTHFKFEYCAGALACCGWREGER